MSNLPTEAYLLEDSNSGKSVIIAKRGDTYHIINSKGKCISHTRTLEEAQKEGQGYIVAEVLGIADMIMELAGQDGPSFRAPPGDPRLN